MAKEIEIELTKELVEAIEGHRGELSVSEFIERGMKWVLDKAENLKG